MSTPHRRIAASYAHRATKTVDPPTPVQQQAMLCELAERHGFMIPPEYQFQDVACRTTSRPGRSAIIAAACGDHSFSRLYVSHPVRLGRWADPQYHFHFRSLLSMLGVEIVFASHQPLEVRR